MSDKLSMQKKLDRFSRWTTRDEIAFIKTLPKIYWPIYRRTMALRHNWDGLDRDRIFKFVSVACEDWS